MIILKGITEGNFNPFLAEVSLLKQLLGRSGKVYVSKDSTACPIGFRGLLTGQTGAKANKPTVVLDNSDIDKLSEGDFVIINANGSVSVVWDATSDTNTVFPTPACNCNCIMCPQPPQMHDEETFLFAEQLVERLDPANVKRLCVTGGEPTLLGDRFIKLMRRINKRFPQASITLLSNGKNFSDFAFTKEFATIGFKDCLTCISLHSDLEELNDKIAGSKGTFHKTTQGLYNLARLRQKVEIRHVVSQLNANRLEDFALFLYRNFPFASHVAIMGMEMTGYAKDNIIDVWIDPYDYREKLANALNILNRAAVMVSAYNIPLCLLEHKSRQFARQSISEWKNSYIDACNGCHVKSSCCGVFTTSENRLSTHIKAIEV